MDKYQIWSNKDRSEISVFALDGTEQDYMKQAYPYDGTKYLELMHEFEAETFEEAKEVRNKFLDDENYCKVDFTKFRQKDKV